MFNFGVRFYLLELKELSEMESWVDYKGFYGGV